MDARSRFVFLKVSRVGVQVCIVRVATMVSDCRKKSRPRVTDKGQFFHQLHRLSNFRKCMFTSGDKEHDVGQNPMTPVSGQKARRHRITLVIKLGARLTETSGVGDRAAIAQHTPQNMVSLLSTVYTTVAPNNTSLSHLVVLSLGGNDMLGGLYINAAQHLGTTR